MAPVILVGARLGERRLRPPALLGEAAPRAPRLSEGGTLRVMTAIGVERLAMGPGIQQSALLELALHLHQQVAELLQQANACRLVVDEGAAAPIGADRAPHHQPLAVDPKAGPVEAGPGGMAAGNAHP